MLQKVTPPEKGIPAAKNFYISNITATHAKIVFDAVGYPQSTLKNFVFSNSRISAAVLGTMEYIEGWKYNNFNISIDKAAPPSKVTGKENEERDYRYKRSEYAARGIAEYWIIDPAKVRITILTLEAGFYEEQVLTGADLIRSIVLPDLALTVDRVLQN